MKKQIIDFIIRLGLIDRPVQHTAKLSVIRTVLKSNISKCQSYDELLSCEKMFQWYVDKYAAEQDPAGLQKRDHLATTKPACGHSVINDTSIRTW